MTSKGCAFLMDMGTGKTITTIALAGTLHHKHKIMQMLVVCPKSIVDVWEQEFEKFADFSYQLAVLDGTSAKKADTIRYMIGNCNCYHRSEHRLSYRNRKSRRAV